MVALHGFDDKAAGIRSAARRSTPTLASYPAGGPGSDATGADSSRHNTPSGSQQQRSGTHSQSNGGGPLNPFEAASGLPFRARATQPGKLAACLFQDVRSDIDAHGWMDEC